MPRPPDAARRAELLSALVDATAEGGIGRRSLRDLAASIGTSHRMLLHYFGSAEELLVAVVDEIEARQEGADASVTGRPSDRLRASWARLVDPAMRPAERQFFELYARGATGEEPFDRFHPHSVERWLPDDSPDPVLHRLALAVVRGLVLDLVATGDEAATTAALDRFAELLDRPG